MISTEANVTTPVVFPFVQFTNTEGVEFDIERSRVMHYETYHEKDEYGNKVYDHNKTFVNFKNPNSKKTGSLYAVVDMPLQAFREHVMRPAYEGQTDTTS